MCLDSSGESGQCGLCLDVCPEGCYRRDQFLPFGLSPANYEDRGPVDSKNVERRLNSLKSKVFRSNEIVSAQPGLETVKARKIAVRFYFVFNGLARPYTDRVLSGIPPVPIFGRMGNTFKVTKHG
jgi:ferredoxin